MFVQNYIKRGLNNRLRGSEMVANECYGSDRITQKSKSSKFTFLCVSIVKEMEKMDQTIRNEIEKEWNREKDTTRG